MYKLASRTFHPKDSVIEIAGNKIGDGNFQIIAGPCTVESEYQVIQIAKSVKAAGATLLRGGAYKPRTSPYAFQGLGKEGIAILLKAKLETGLPVVTELMDTSDLNLFDEVDVIQVGAKNMQNYPLLKALGKIKKPILLKRGSGNTIEELLFSAEYILSNGNKNVILCERGIRTFENATRFTFDINAIPLLKKLTHLPVIADPSHGTGLSDLVAPISLAATAAGADGLIIEVHNDPEHALCDGQQALTQVAFAKLANNIMAIKPYSYKP